MKKIIIIKTKSYLLFLIFLIKALPIASNTCKSNAKISNTDCFTDLIKFDQKNYRAGHAIVTKSGELLIEFSIDDESSERLFYGLKKNGRNYFPDDSFIKIIDVGSDQTRKSRYESMNRLVKINDGSNDGKEYILSISTFKTLMELYDIETWNFTIKNSISYLENQIFSFKFQILEAIYNNNYVYFIVFSHKDNYWDNGLYVGREEGPFVTLARFQFSSLDFDASLVTHIKVEDNKFSDRVVTSFIIEELQLFY